jgi:hypothetical protein
LPRWPCAKRIRRKRKWPCRTRVLPAAGRDNPPALARPSGYKKVDGGAASQARVSDRGGRRRCAGRGDLIPKRRVISLLSVLVLLAAGCGDDEPSSDNRAPGRSADSCKLLTNDEIAARIGGGFEPEAKTGRTLDAFALSQCVWEAGDAKVAVAVVGSAERYRMHEKRDLGEPVEGLGDAALVETGTSLEDRGGTGGRTVFVLDGDRTLVVALDRGRSEEVTVDAVVELARSAHERLP